MRQIAKHLQALMILFILLNTQCSGKPCSVQTCNWQCYIARYADLGQFSLDQASQHYTNWGQREGRDCTCHLPGCVKVQPHQVMPSLRHRTHAVWLNGPTNSDKLKINDYWPEFGALKGMSGAQCTRKDDKYTGYDTEGAYCQRASGGLNTNPHLALYSGKIGVVVDTRAANGLFPKLGTTASISNESLSAPRQVYDHLPDSSSNIKVDICGKEYSLAPPREKLFIPSQLVRQGHAVTQVTLSNFDLVDVNNARLLCEGTEKHPDDNIKCNQNFGGSSFPCPATYSACRGFVQGKTWGKCYKECKEKQVQLWMEIAIWGDSISFKLAWDEYKFEGGCTPTVSFSLTSDGVPLVSKSKVWSATQKGSIDILLMSRSKDNAIVTGTDANAVAYPVTVTSETNDVIITSRAAQRDVFVEVPAGTPRCGYNTDCSKVGLIKVKIVAKNVHRTAIRSLRLSFHRNFNHGQGFTSRSKPSAEITGLVAQLWNTNTDQPSGIPIQLSKNWHKGDYSLNWAGHDGFW